MEASTTEGAAAPFRVFRGDFRFSVRVDRSFLAISVSVARPVCLRSGALAQQPPAAVRPAGDRRSHRPRRRPSTACSTRGSGSRRRPSTSSCRSSRSKASRRPRRPRSASCSRRPTIYVGVICFDSEPSQIVTTDSRRDSGADRPGLVPDDLRHLPRPPERLHLRHQRRRHPVRRAGAQRRRDAARRSARRARRRQHRRRRRRRERELGRLVGSEDARHRDRLDGGVRHPAAHAALRSAAAGLGREFLARHRAEARVGVLVAGVADLHPHAVVVGRRAARAWTCRRRAISS